MRYVLNVFCCLLLEKFTSHPVKIIRLGLLFSIQYIVYDTIPPHTSPPFYITTPPYKKTTPLLYIYVYFYYICIWLEITDTNMIRFRRRKALIEQSLIRLIERRVHTVMVTVKMCLIRVTAKLF